MVEVVKFSTEDRRALSQILGSTEPIADLEDAVTMVLMGDEFRALNQQYESRAAFVEVSKATSTLLAALEKLSSDNQERLLQQMQPNLYVHSEAEAEITLVSLVLDLWVASNAATPPVQKGRPVDPRRWELAVYVAGALRKFGISVTSTENGRFVACLEICGPLVGIDVHDFKNIARIVTAKGKGKKPAQ